ncbi:MAG: hypothetical protein IPF66_24540 [Holophagales bacterium]|nr:hypothetical protein [Holophagales bacterium]
MFRPKPGDPPPDYIAALRESIARDPDGLEAKDFRWNLRDGFSEDDALLTVARSRLGLCEPGTLVVLRQNPSLYLLADARTLAALAKLAAREGDSWLEASHTRASILLTVAALEGFINAVYENSDTPHLDTKLRMHPREKWLRAPHAVLPYGGRLWDGERLLYSPGDPIESFVESEEPFKSFSELWTLRNDMVHPRSIERAHACDNIPPLDEIGERYAHTDIPKEFRFWRHQDARRVHRIAWAMIRSLNTFLKNQLSTGLGRPFDRVQHWPRNESNRSGGLDRVLTWNDTRR